MFGRKKKSNIYASCKICGAETSKTGNVTNMILSGLTHDPEGFNEKYGMMCKEHAGQVTQQIMQENNLSDDDFEAAFSQAEEIVLNDTN